MQGGEAGKAAERRLGGGGVGGASPSLKRGRMFREAAETKYHRLGDLNQQRCILSHFLGPEV